MHSSPLRPVRRVWCQLFFVSLLTGASACAGPLASEPEVAVASSPPHDLAASTDDDGAALQTRALEACQAASDQLDAGDVTGAVARIDEAYELMLKLPDTDEAYAQTKQDIRLVVAQTIARIYTTAEPASPFTASRDLGLPLVDNEHVAYEIKSFTTTERQSFLDAYARAGRYRPMILEKLAQAGLPSQLAWLPLVESLFKVQALSRASALGLWQFISSTGLRYGLERTEWIDERIDPEKSTDAAIAYLADLHRLFGDWQKALAAYNCGEGRIQRLQKRAETEYLDFWDLYMSLPAETRRYVPRLIAVLKILEDPAAYGLELPEPHAPLGPTQVVPVQRAVKLSLLDEALGLQPGTLAAHNPGLRHGATPPTAYALRVPEGQAETVVAALGGLPEYSPPKPQYSVHRVRSGETLSGIAERYRTSVSFIMRLNNMRSAHLIWPGQRLRVPFRS